MSDTPDAPSEAAPASPRPTKPPPFGLGAAADASGFSSGHGSVGIAGGASEPDASPSASAERRERLSKVAFFEGLVPEALGLLAAVVREETHGKNTRLFAYGDPGDRLYILIEGKVRISREVAGMGEEALAVLGPGEVFGEMSLFDDAPRSADAIVHERCRVLVLSKAAFDDLLFVHKDLAYEVLWNAVRILSSRLRETNEKLTFLTVSGKF
jgi:CRP-like cAMP-binding protein